MNRIQISDTMIDVISNGSDIYALYNVICDRELPMTLAVLRSVQLGLFQGHILKDACSRQDYSGKKLVPVKDLYQKIKEQLPSFDNQTFVQSYDHI